METPKKTPTAHERKLAGRRRWMRFPVIPGNESSKFPAYEPINTKPLDFEDRSSVDWSGYYQDGEKATDNE